MQPDVQTMPLDQSLLDREETQPAIHEIEPTPDKPQPEPEAAKTEVGDGCEDLDSAEWSRFEILPLAPPDHAFCTTPHAQPSKEFLGHLNREYRAVKSILPGE